jgi:hypothetical protein
MSNVHHLLIKKGLKNGNGVFGEIHNQHRQMIRHHIFGTFLIPNLYIELLQQQNPLDEMRFSVFISRNDTSMPHDPSKY